MMSVPLTANGQQIEYKDIYSPTTGRVTYSMPLPSDWQVNRNPNSDYFVSGPGGIKIYHSFKNEYFYGQNMGGYGNVGGRQFMAPMSADQYFQQIVKPHLQSQGHRFITSYAIPEYVGLMNKFAAGMPNTGTRRSFYAIGSDWQTGRGEKSMVTTVLSFVEGPAGVTWYSQMTQMEAPSSKFDWAKRTVRNGVQKAKIGSQNQSILNRELVQFNRENDRKSAERMARSQREHDIRMEGIAAAGRASTARARDGMDALDSSMSSYQRIQAMKDGGQANSVRGIHGETIISDPYSGRRYDGAPAGRGNYWVGPDGELMTTEDPNYNPNTDNSVNSHDWTKFEPE